MKISSTTFKYLWWVLAPKIGKTNIQPWGLIFLKTKLAITLSKLGSENVLLACNAIYELIIGTTSIIVKECYTPI
jgi:hypothetical protein